MGLLQVRRSTAATPEGLVQDRPLIDVGLLLVSPTAPCPSFPARKAGSPPHGCSVFPTPRHIDTVNQAEVSEVGMPVLWTTGPEL